MSMSVLRVEKIIEDVNAKVEGGLLARLLNYHPEKIQVAGPTIKCFCPLHHEQAFRSLLIDTKNRTYRCSMKHCRGFDGGTYVQLWASHLALEPLEAALDLAEKLKLDIDVAALRALGGSMIERARTAMAKRDFAGARQAAEQATAFMPRDAEAGKVLAEVYRASGEAERSAEQFFRVIDLYIEARDFASARSLLVPLEAELGHSLELALRKVSLARAESDSRRLVESLISLAEVYDLQRDEMAQIGVLDELSELGGAEAAVFERIAQLHERSRRADKAIETLQKLEALYELEAMWNELYSVLRRHEKLEPGNLPLREQIALALLRMGDVERGAEQFLDLAAYHKNLGDIEKARDLLNKLLAAQPSNTGALEKLAAWSAEAGQPAEAIRVYRKLAAIARTAGEIERSTRYLTLAKVIDPEDYGLRSDLAEARLAQNDTEKGIAELFELANLFLNESDPSKGFEALDRIRSISLDDVGRQIEIGRCLEAAGHDDRALTGYLEFVHRMQQDQKHEAALAVLEEVRRLSPRDESILELRLISCNATGNKAGAIEACRDMAKSWMAISDYDHAEQVLLRAIRVDRTEPSAKTDLAQLYELMGRNGEAVQLWLEAALFHRAGENREKSLQAAREALRLDPRNGEAKGIMAEALETQGDIAGALDLWKQAADDLLEKQSESPAALRILQHALKLSPNDSKILAAVAILSCAISGAASARPAFDRWVENLTGERDLPAIEAALEKAVEHYPSDQEWRSRLADMLIDRGSATQALPHLEALLKIQRETKTVDEAYARTLERLVRIRPEKVDLRMEWAEAVASLGGAEKAKAIFSEVARQHLARGDHKQGLAVFQRALVHQPEDLDLHSRVAELLETSGRTDEAIRAYEKLAELQHRAAGTGSRNLAVVEKLISLCPDRLDLRLQLGQTYEAQGRLQEAVEQYYRIALVSSEKEPASDSTLQLCRKILDLVPEFMSGRDLLVGSHLARKEYAAAKRELDRMADLALHEGDLAQAELLFKRIIEIDPQDIGSGERLGKLYEARGQTKEAAEAYRKVLTLYRELKDIDRSISVLRKLRGLEPANLDVRRELARALAPLTGRAAEARDEWQELIALELKTGRPELAKASAAESFMLFADQWDRRFQLMAMFGAVLDKAEAAAGWGDLARDAHAQSEDETAIRAASEGLKLIPGDIPLRELRVEASRARQEWDLAHSDLSLLASESARLGQHAIAERYLERGIEIRPDDDALIGMLVEAQLAQKNLEDAVQTLRHLADLLRGRGDLPGAIRRAEQIAELKPNVVEALDYLAELLIEGERTDAAMIIWGQIAESLAAGGEYLGAIMRLDAILERQPRDVEVLRRVADITLQAAGAEDARGRTLRLLDVMIADAPRESTRAEFERVLKAQPEELGLAEKYATFLSDCGDARRATDTWGRIAKTQWKERRNLEDALRALREIRRIDPSLLGALEDEAAVLEEMGRPEEAVAALRLLAKSRVRIGEHELGAEAIGHCARLLPGNIEAQIEAAETYEELGFAEKAVAFYLKGIELQDKTGDFAASIPLLQRCRKLNPGRRELSEALAGLYERTGKLAEAGAEWLELGSAHEAAAEPERAAAIYEHIKEFLPKELEARRRLARIAENAGRIDNAIEELRKLAALTSAARDHEQTIAILRRMRELDPADHAPLAALADEFRRLRRNPELCDVLLELEAHYSNSGELELALAALEELKSLRPNDIELSIRTFGLLARAGQFAKAGKLGQELIETFLTRSDLDDARKMMRQVAAIEPENIDRRITLAQRAMNHGAKDLAIEELLAGADELWKGERKECCLALCRAALEVFPEEIALRERLIQSLRQSGLEAEAAAELLSLAELHETEGRDDEAIRILHAILEDQPDHQQAHEALVNLGLKRGDLDTVTEHNLRLAEIHYVAGRLCDSIAALERLLGAVPERNELRRRLAELYHEAGDDDQARHVWSETATRLRKAGEVKAAIEVYERLKELDPEDMPTLSELAECYWLVDSPQLYMVHATQLAALQLARGNARDAVQSLSVLAERFPQNIEAREQLTEARLAAGDAHGAVETLKDIAALHTASKRLDRARATIERTLELAPDDFGLAEELGEVCLKLGQKMEGLRHLTSAAGAMRRTGRLEPSRALLDRVLKLDPANLETRQAMAELCEALGDNAGAAAQYAAVASGWAEQRNYAQANESYRRLLELQPGRVEEREAYAHGLEREGRLAESREQYLHLIHDLGDEGDPRHVIRYCRQILKDAPEHVEAHVQLCRVYEKTEKPRLALQECQWLAAHHLANGSPANAEEYIRRGIAHAPDEVELRKQLIGLLIETGRFEEAGATLGVVASLAETRGDGRLSRWALERACDIMPANVDYRQRLGDLQEQAGEIENAQATRLELMKLYLDRAQMEEARRCAERVIEAAPGDDVLRRKVAEIFENNGLPEVAAFHYQAMASAALSAERFDEVRELAAHILKIKPRHVGARECLFEALRASGDAAGAAAQCRDLYEIHFEDENYEAAQRRLKFLIEFKPSDPEPRHLLIEVLRKLGHTEQVTEHLRRLAEIHATNGDVARAIETLRALITQAPDDTRARSRYIDLFSQIGDESELYQDFLALAAIHRRNGNVVDATKLFERIITQHPERVTPRDSFVDFLFEQGQIHRGVAESRALAALHLKAEQKLEASKVLDRALAQSPEDVDLRYQLALLQIRTNRRGLALETFRGLLKAFEASADLPRQAEVIEQMVELDPMNVEMSQRLADLYTQQGETEKAKRHRMVLAEQYLSRHLYDLAEREYRRILDLSPGDAAVWQRVIEAHLQIGSASEVIPDMVILANIYITSGRLKDAVETYRQILDLEPNNVEILSKYIEAYLQIGLEQDLVDDYLRLATLLSRSGDVQGSLAIYQHLKGIAPGNELVDKQLRETGMTLKKSDLPASGPTRASGPGRDLADFLDYPEPAQESAEERVLKAIRNFENILKLNPENPQVRAKLADLLVKNNRQSEADLHWTQAAEDFFIRGDFQRASDIFHDLLTRHPKDAHLRERLSKTKLQLDSLNAIDRVLNSKEFE